MWPARGSVATAQNVVCSRGAFFEQVYTAAVYRAVYTVYPEAGQISNSELIIKVTVI